MEFGRLQGNCSARIIRNVNVSSLPLSLSPQYGMNSVTPTANTKLASARKPYLTITITSFLYFVLRLGSSTEEAAATPRSLDYGCAGMDLTRRALIVLTPTRRLD